MLGLRPQVSGNTKLQKKSTIRCLIVGGGGGSATFLKKARWGAFKCIK